jgi:hypothetical protein
LFDLCHAPGTAVRWGTFIIRNNVPISSLTGQNIGVLPGQGNQSGAGTYGKVPFVPSPIYTQGQAVSGNLGNLGNLYGLTGSLNTEIAQQAALPFQLNLPNYGAMTGQSSKNILSELQGQVPQDVANQLSQMAAERGISTGSIGSPNANSALMRSLGLTSLGLQQQGEQNLSGAVARTPTGQQFNPQNFLVSPSQMQEAQYLANLYAAAPTPGAGDKANLNALLKGLGGLGGAGGVRGGGPSAPGADWFGQVYNPGLNVGGGGGGGGGAIPGGSMGWPGGAQSGQLGPQGWQTGVAGGTPWSNDITANPLFNQSNDFTEMDLQSQGSPYGMGGYPEPGGWQAGMPYTPGPGDQPTAGGGYGGPSWPQNMFADMGG